jgi:biotin carboxyl carrier protein
MRRYTVRINDADHVLDVEELARDTFTVHLADGRLVDVMLTDHQDLAQAVIAPQLERGHPRLASAVVQPEAAKPSAVQTTARTPSPGRAGGRSVTSPMPGVILTVEVAVGDAVERGQALMVLEAMKMKNEIKAERDGRIAAVLVAAGQQVTHGDVLVEYES